MSFKSGRSFPNQYQLNLELFDYVHWFNHIRIHGSLDYLTPTEYKLINL
ncbi:IS3 family transposase [Alteribacillus sp. JSM 102045]